MFTEERYSIIIELVNRRKAVTVAELSEELDASPATVRRDLTELHRRGKLQKVHGGATSIEVDYYTDEKDMPTKNLLFMDEKQMIAMEAASLITPDDFVYIDAGTSTEVLINYIQSSSATFVTNGLTHAARLSARGFKVSLPAGTVKHSTLAIVGTETVEYLRNCNFTKGFFGTNGISLKAGYTTPDTMEATIKETALHRCKKAYILADPSKFDKIAPITFAPLEAAEIYTTILKNQKYKAFTTIREVR